MSESISEKAGLNAAASPANQRPQPINPKNAHQHKPKPKPKQPQKIIQSTAVASVPSVASGPKVALHAPPSAVKSLSAKPTAQPKLLPSYNSRPLPPLISHDISISEDEHDVSLPPPPPPTCDCCCGRSLSLSWESSWAIRCIIRRSSTRNSVRSIHNQLTGKIEFVDSNICLNVRIPVILLALLLALFACATFANVRPFLPPDPNDLMEFRHGGGHRPPPFGRPPPSSHHNFHLHELPEGKNASLLANLSTTATTTSLTKTSGVLIATDDHENFDVINERLTNPSKFLTTPYLVLATTPTGAPGPGLHVPCQWLEERFGKQEQFDELRTTIELVRQGKFDPSAPPPPPPPPPAAVVAAAPPASSPFIHTERSEADHLLDSVGIYCQSEVLRDKCEFEGGRSTPPGGGSRMGSHSAAEISRLHQWVLSLPEAARFEDPVRTSASASTPDMVTLNKLTGAIATLNCRNVIRYSAPFANNEQASVYIEPNSNAIPEAYSHFVEHKCSKEAMDATANAKATVTLTQSDNAGPAALHPGQPPPPATENGAATTIPDPPAAESMPPKRAKWVEPLIPLLPPICSASSFSRPSLARACLRNSRIIAFGDSTLQELLLTLIDFLEQDDGEDPADLTRMRVDESSKEGRARSAEQAQEWMPPSAGSDGLTRYFFIEHWAPPESCYMAAALTFLGRLFTTARFPTPYLAAYNITITMQWNVDAEVCAAYRGPNYASDIAMYRSAYRFLGEACLPDNAVEIAKKYRLKPDGTYRSGLEYNDHVNSIFHNTIRDNQKIYLEEPPPFGCKFPYLPPEESSQLTLPEWPLHLSTVPSFDFAILNLGAHQTKSWGNADSQRGESGYSWNAEQYHHAVEAHVQLVQAFARNVVIRETGWRSDAHFGATVPAINVILREVALEAQARALQRDMEIAKLLEVARQATVGGKRVNMAAVAPPRRSVSWLPTYFFTILLKKDDPVHCSFKAIAGGNGVNGIRTPFCYALAQKMIELFCSNK